MWSREQRNPLKPEQQRTNVYRMQWLNNSWMGRADALMSAHTPRSFIPLRPALCIRECITSLPTDNAALPPNGLNVGETGDGS